MAQQRATRSGASVQKGQPTSRTTGFQKRPSQGNTTKVSSRMDVNTSPKVPRQASQNNGPMTQHNAGTQRMGRTQNTTPGHSFHRNGAQPRAQQNTMTGKGSKSG